MQYSVGVGAKRATHKVQKGQTHAMKYTVHSRYTVRSRYAVCSRYAVFSRYAVSVSAKRSTHKVDLANMVGGDHYL